MRDSDCPDRDGNWRREQQRRRGAAASTSLALDVQRFPGCPLPWCCVRRGSSAHTGRHGAELLVLDPGLTAPGSSVGPGYFGLPPQMAWSLAWKWDVLASTPTARLPAPRFLRSTGAKRRIRRLRSAVPPTGERLIRVSGSGVLSYGELCPLGRLSASAGTQCDATRAELHPIRANPMPAAVFGTSATLTGAVEPSTGTL